VIHWLLIHALHWAGSWGFYAIATVALVGGYFLFVYLAPVAAVAQRGAFIVALAAVWLAWGAQTLGHRNGVESQKADDEKEISAAHLAQGKAEADKAFADAQVLKIKTASADTQSRLDELRRNMPAAIAAAAKRDKAINGTLGPDCAKADEYLGAFLERNAK